MASMGQIYPPAILGHDEQELLKNSGHPAAAWVHDVRVIDAPTPEDPMGQKLQAKMGDAPGSVARLINRRAYRKTSAEVYDEPPDGCRIPGVKGKVLRAVAFLGREIPRVKRLEDIPQFNEKTGESTDWVDIFATGEYDGIKYDRADMQDMKRNYKLLCKAGVNPSKFSEKQGRQAAGACRRIFMDAPQSPTGASQMDELRKQLIAAGMPQDVVNAMDDAALGSFAQACSKFAAPAQPAAPAVNSDGDDDENKSKTPPDGGAQAGAMTAGEGGPAMNEKKTGGPMTANQYSELCNRIRADILSDLKKTGTNADALQARVHEIDQQTRKRLFSERVDTLLKGGQISPAVNEGDLIVGIALDLDSTKLRKFGEKDLSLEARFGMLLDRLAEMKPMKTGERAPSGEPDARKFSEAQKGEEVKKVEAHYSRYSDQFAKIGTSQDDYVKSFKTVQKERGVTAEEFTGVRD